MPNLNKVMLMGHAGKDCELRYLASGQPQAKFSLATTERFQKDGEWQEKTTWHNIIIWGDLAERISQYIEKGTPVFVEGRIENRTWDDDQGKKHYMTEINASSVQTLTPREKAPADTRSTQRSTRQAKPSRDVDPDDLPWE